LDIILKELNSRKKAIQMKSPVYLLFGGASSERFVSVASARYVAEVCPEFIPLFWTSSGAVQEVAREDLFAATDVFIKEFSPKNILRCWSSIEALLATVDGMACFYLALHGGAGEDGTVQKLFEDLRIPFTGSSSKASALAMSKPAAKKVVKEWNIQVAADVTFQIDEAGYQEKLREFFDRHQSIVIKPASEGSSAGLAFVRDASQLDHWLKSSHGETRYFIAEECLVGREFTIGVVDRIDHMMVLPCSEVILDRGAHFDYQGKYLGKGNKEITPAALSKRQSQEAQRAVMDAHIALECLGYSRTELILTERGFFYLETNTLPGLTGASFIPQQLQAAGIDMKDFVSWQIEIAKKRYSI
jgi:D-alanine-D-alanine ligase